MRMLSSPPMHAWRLVAFCLALAASSCASAPIAAVVVPPAPVAPPDITQEEKLRWILSLEDRRILRDPEPPPPAILQPATATTPAVTARPAPSDLVLLLKFAVGATLAGGVGSGGGTTVSRLVS